MASPLGGPAANLLVLLKVILLATLVVSAVAVGNVPGLKWSALEVWEGGAYGGCRRSWGSPAMVKIYRVIMLGVLCSQILLASLDRTPYEVNTFTSE